MWWTGFAGVLAFGVIMTVRAYGEGLPAIFGRQHVDKIAHFCTAGLLAFFLDGAVARRRLFARGAAVMPFAAAAVLVPAGIEEYLQRYATFRTSSIYDFLADALGVLVFIPLSRRVAK